MTEIADMTSIPTTLTPFILNNRHALQHMLDNGIACLMTESSRRLRTRWAQWAYLAFYEHDSSRPRHIFDERWKSFCAEMPEEMHIMEYALEYLGKNYLEYNNKELFVRHTEMYERWQNYHSRMSMQPVVAYYAAQRNVDIHEHRDVLYPYNQRVEDYIRREGLNETHMHINLCISSEEVWLYYLYHLPSYYRALKAELSESDLSQILKQVDFNLDLREHMRRMKLAARLRKYIWATFNNTGEISPDIKLIDQIITGDEPESDPTEYPSPELDDELNFLTLDDLMVQERQLWRKLDEWGKEGHDHYSYICHLLHLYLLIENQFVSLIRYRDNQIGIQEFCMISQYPRNLKTEELHKKAFHASRRHTAKGKNNIEVRASPSNLPTKVQGLLNAAYAEAREKERITDPGFMRHFVASHPLPYNLVLVTHLIKRKFPGNSDTERLQNARCRCAMDVAPLLEWHRSGKNRYIPIGIDAAGSEVLLPVDAFVPAYRLFGMYNTNARTYHCGEDFRHLVSGMRAVYDAVTLLGFTPGNRVGHAVALGIHPELWLETMPAKIVMTNRDWLWDMIFCRKMFMKYGLPESDSMYRIEEEIQGLAANIFETPLDLHTMSALYEARSLVPEFIYLYLSQHGNKDIRELMNCQPLGDISLNYQLEQEEMKRIGNFTKRYGKLPLEKYAEYLTDKDIQERMDQIAEKETAFLSAACMLKVQQHMQRFMKEKGIVIETLPVSNYRLTGYESMKDHHIFRWLQIPGRAVEGDTEMDICLGSDDPGIFASDIKSDFYHLFSIMKEYGLSDAEAVEKLAKLNDTGRIHSFDPVKAGSKEQATDDWK